MRLQEIIGILTNHLFLVILAIIFCIGVFFIVKKISGGKIGSYKKLLPLCILLAYIVLVIGITFFNRGESGYGRVNLALFQSYKEAWYLFDLGHWQLVILNICMFIPFGFLMPIIHQRFKTFIWLFLATLLFTLMIETGQYITKVGLFELDDIFNNSLGAIVGYGLIMTIYSLIHKDWKQAMLRSIPNVCVVLAFLSIFTIYHLKEFGNLPIVAIENVDVSTSAMQNDLKLSSEEKSVPIYKAPTLSKNDADQFVTNFFANQDLETSDMEIIRYDKESVYWVRGEETYNIWLNYLDGSYSYTDFSTIDEDTSRLETDESTLLTLLSELHITVPEEAKFHRVEKGTYEWKVEQLQSENALIDGNLLVNYVGTLQSVKQNIVKYEKVKDVRIKSELEAYEELLKGKFIYHANNQKIASLHVQGITIQYVLDSKSFYQPVYAFECKVDGEVVELLIQAL